MKKINIATVFSGIGAFEQALLKQKIEHNIVFACDTGERYLNQDFESINNSIKDLNDTQKINFIEDLYNKKNKRNYVKDSYFANYDISEDRWFTDIRFLNGKPFKNKVDIFVGGSPCQSFSLIGKRRGLDDARGTLFFDFARLVKEIQPKVFIFENVVGLLVHDHGKTWSVIKDIFASLNYDIHFSILNSKDYGIPQDRKRVFVVGFKNKSLNFQFPKPIKLEKFSYDFLEKSVAARHYLGKKGFEFVTNPKYLSRARVNRKIIQTQKAHQQYNRNGDFVFEKLNDQIHNNEIKERAYLGVYKNETGYCRQLSYRECLRLMGFSDDFKIVVPNVQIYRQAGNSIVVNVLEEIMKEIIKTGVFDEKN